ncbi:MAG TPA: PLDc N-terminal domain-containing protein [bacterium]|jgi:hypothetical protein|nr:PLDc N-terminal domain-containing protein [bacterium]
MLGCLYLVALGLALCLFALALLGVLGALTMIAFHLSGLVVLLLDVIAVIEIVKSRDDGTKKAIWILMIIFLPVLGLLLWFFLGRKRS